VEAEISEMQLKKSKTTYNDGTLHHTFEQIMPKYILNYVHHPEGCFAVQF
jgi:hypothetical protein